MRETKSGNLKLIYPILSIVFTLLCCYFIPNNQEISNNLPYLSFFLIISVIIYLLLVIYSFKNKKFKKNLIYKSPLLSVLFLVLNVYNLITLKFNLIDAMYFPYPDKIFSVFLIDRNILIKSLLYSFRLQILAIIIGGFIGVLTGILTGWNKKGAYWINPIINTLGPIPSVSLLPIIMTIFSSTFIDSLVIVSISVWFPTAVLTASGIKNIEKGYFEVAETLGASSWYQIFHIALPGSMSSIFVGFFNGICTSFVSLFTSEMIGAEFGIGWYINWQKEALSYANVYAGLILIILFCSFFIKVLFFIRSKILVWQKGVIKW